MTTKTKTLAAARKWHSCDPQIFAAAKQNGHKTRIHTNTYQGYTFENREVLCTDEEIEHIYDYFCP
jgi:hypothetical protein